MAADALMYLTYMGIFLLIGLLCTIFAAKLKLPNVLLLVLVGILLKFVKYRGESLFSIPPSFTITLGVLALIMVVYDSASKFKINELNTLSWKSLKLTVFFIILILFMFTLCARFILGIDIYLAVLFASFMAGTSPDTTMAMLSAAKNKIAELLEIESIVNTPPLVLLPFIIIDLIRSVSYVNVDTVIEQFVPFIQQIVVGLGAGLLVGVVVFKVMSKFYEPHLSPIATIAAALITYVLAENLGGNGVLAVTTLAVIIGNIYIKHKDTLANFASTFSEFLRILVFIMLGLLIDVDWSTTFMIQSIALFTLYLLIRFLAVQMSFIDEYNLREKIFMTVNAPKGIATAVVIFLLSTYDIPGLSQILDYGLAIILYSIVLATVIMKFTGFFFREQEEKPKPTEQQRRQRK
jgi:cell volume regulation protein A